MDIISFVYLFIENNCENMSIDLDTKSNIVTKTQGYCEKEVEI